MLATAKHFPGHGDTGTDSHIALPVITAPWARFDTLELVPFRAAIAAGVTAVMSAHIALPGLDSGRTRPGTVEPGNPPSSVSGISVSAPPIASAAGAQPEPSTTTASCEPARAVSRAALACAAAKGSAAAC